MTDHLFYVAQPVLLRPHVAQAFHAWKCITPSGCAAQWDLDLVVLGQTEPL